jgi:hypothetical protein
MHRRGSEALKRSEMSRCRIALVLGKAVAWILLVQKE